MEVFNTDSAVLDMNFLLLSISMIFRVALALVRGLIVRGCLRCCVWIDGKHAAVDAVCWRRKGVGVSG
jgi:uncharacterized membrane protein YGL010W